MIWKHLIVGLLLGGSLLLLGAGLKQTILGIGALLLELGAGAVAPVAAFGLFPVLLAVLLLGPAGGGYRVIAVSGPLAGRQYRLTAAKRSLSFGRENCDVQFPEDTKGVSAHHCRLELRGDTPILIDSSSYGTFLLPSGQQLPRAAEIPLADGARFYLAQRNMEFLITKDQ